MLKVTIDNVLDKHVVPIAHDARPNFILIQNNVKLPT